MLSSPILMKEGEREKGRNDCASQEMCGWGKRRKVMNEED